MNKVRKTPQSHESKTLLVVAGIVKPQVTNTNFYLTRVGFFGWYYMITSEGDNIMGQ